MALAASPAAWAEAETTVNAFSGSLSTAVPIGVPGYRGLEPKLAIQYSSQGGNGLIGVGWSLGGVSVIERASSGRGVPRYDGSDVYVLDGNQLIPGCGTFGGTHCTRVESYRRITWDGANNRWYGWNKDGTRSTYAPLLSTAKGTHRWGLTEVRDTKSNVVTYGYTCPGGDCYLDNVSYNGVVVKLYWEGRSDPITYAIGGQNVCYNTCYQTCYQSCCTSTDKYGTCVAYSQCNPYQCNPYQCNPYPCGAGGLATTAYRLRSVDVKVGGARARTYRLAYTATITTGRSLLSTVQQYGTDAVVDGSGVVTGGTALPAMTASWQLGGTVLGDVGFTPLHSSWAGYKVHAKGDFNGDGRADLYLNIDNLGGGAVPHIWYGQAGGGFLDAGFAPLHSSWAGMKVLATGDFNADGMTDVYLNYDNLGAGAVQHIWYGQAGTGGFYDVGLTPLHASWAGMKVLATGDFNGDGMTDAYLNYDNLGAGAVQHLWYGQAGFGGFYDLGLTPLHSSWGGMKVITTGDFDGDGKTDVYLNLDNLGAGAVQHLWYGQAGTSGFHDVGLTPLHSSWSSYRALATGDFNGDGKTDVYLNLDNLGAGAVPHIWYGTGAPLGFTDVGFTPLHSSWAGYKVHSIGDFNADGHVDVYLNIDNLGGGATPHLWYGAGQGFTDVGLTPLHSSWAGYKVHATGDFNGDGKLDAYLNIDNLGGGAVPHQWLGTQGAHPALITSLASGLGGTTSFTYSPSSAWSNTYLPAGVVMQTVASVTTNDGRGEAQTTTYAYQGARWRNATAADPTSEFLGFRKATTTIGATGAYSETYYWQRAGTIAKPEVVYKRKPNGAIMSFDKLYFSENTAPPYTSVATQAWSYECNGNGVVDANHNYVSGCRRVVTTYEWDAYANMTREYQYGDYDLGGDERTAVRSFAPNTSTYVVGMPAYEELRAGIGAGGTLLARTRFFYDGAASEATAPTEGKLTRKGLWNDQTGLHVEHSFGYDSYGNETSVTDPLGRTATKTYDGTYHLLTTSSTNELGHVVQSGWDTLGRLTSNTDADGNVTTHTYDVFGRGLLTTKPGGAQVKVEHLAYGDLANQRVRTSSLLPNGQWVYDDSYFDGLGRTYRTVSSTGVTSDTLYGAAGKVWKRSLPYLAGETVRYDVHTYDEVGREVSVQLPDGATVSKGFVNGAVTTTDVIGNVRTSWFDGYGRLTAQREVIGGVNRDTYFYYDLLGRRTRSVDALGHQTVATYDSLGRVLQKSDPDQGLWQYRYDDLGRITKETDALSRVTALGYDVLGRVTRRTYHDGSYDSFTFDEAGRGSAKGRLTTSVSASGVTTRAWYDGMGRRTRYEEVIDGTTHVLSHSYDLAGRLATATYPDGEVVTYGYGTSGLQTGKLVSVSGSVAGTLVSAIGYSSKGQVSSVTYGNGVTSTTGFDTVGERVTSIQIGGLATISYGYDANGRITAMASAQLGLTNWTYGYDSIGRLTRATNTADGTKSETFSYDAGGRMLSKSSLGSYTYGDAAHGHAVTAAGANTYAYDANGNMTSGAGRSFTYDQDHRPLSITYGGSTTSFVYDAQGLRVKKSGASGTVVYVGGVQEKRGTAVTKYYFAGGLRVAKRDANGNQYLHADHLGSTRLVTNQSGAEVNRYEYAAYGAVIGQSGTLPDSHRYAGHEADDETGLVFFQARYYDPTLGRFVQPDSFVPNGNSPQDLDLYAYAGNSPINYVDPSGHAPVLVAVGAMSAATAATVTAIGLTVGTLVNIAAVVIGTALTFTNSPILQTIGMVMAGMGGAALFGGPSLFGAAAWGPTATGGLVALAQSPISPLDPTVKKVIGWAYTIAGAVKNIGEVASGEKPWTPFGIGKDSSWAYTRSVGGAVTTWDWVKATLAVGASDILKTAAGWAAAYVLSGSEIGRYVSAFASRFVMASMQGTAGPLAVIGATYDLAYTLKYPDGRVYDLSGGAGGEAFTFYYHTGFESPGFAMGRQHIRVAGRGGYWELGDTRAGFFGPGLGWGGWIGTQKITVIMSPAQAAAFVGAMEAAAASGGRYQGYHADSHTYVSAALQFATGKSAADLHINPGLVHW